MPPPPVLPPAMLPPHVYYNFQRCMSSQSRESTPCVSTTDSNDLHSRILITPTREMLMPQYIMCQQPQSNNLMCNPNAFLQPEINNDKICDSQSQEYSSVLPSKTENPEGDQPNCYSFDDIRSDERLISCNSPMKKSLKSIPSVSNINVYEDDISGPRKEDLSSQNSSSSTTTSSEEIDENTEIGEELSEDTELIEQVHYPHQLSIIYEENENSLRSNDMSRCSTLSDCSTTLMEEDYISVDNYEEFDTDSQYELDQNSVTVRLPLKFSFSRSKDNLVNTTLTVGESQINEEQMSSSESNVLEKKLSSLPEKSPSKSGSSNDISVTFKIPSKSKSKTPDSQIVTANNQDSDPELSISFSLPLKTRKKSISPLQNELQPFLTIPEIVLEEKSDNSSENKMVIDSNLNSSIDAFFDIKKEMEEITYSLCNRICSLRKNSLSVPNSETPRSSSTSQIEDIDTDTEDDWSAYCNKNIANQIDSNNMMEDPDEDQNSCQSGSDEGYDFWKELTSVNENRSDIETSEEKNFALNYMGTGSDEISDGEDLKFNIQKTDENLEDCTIIEDNYQSDSESISENDNSKCNAADSSDSGDLEESINEKSGQSSWKNKFGVLDETLHASKSVTVDIHRIENENILKNYENTMHEPLLKLEVDEQSESGSDYSENESSDSEEVIIQTNTKEIKKKVCVTKETLFHAVFKPPDLDLTQDNKIHTSAGETKKEKDCVQFKISENTNDDLVINEIKDTILENVQIGMDRFVDEPVDSQSSNSLNDYSSEEEDSVEEESDNFIAKVANDSDKSLSQNVSDENSFEINYSKTLENKKEQKEQTACNGNSYYADEIENFPSQLVTNATKFSNSNEDISSNNLQASFQFSDCKIENYEEETDEIKVNVKSKINLFEKVNNEQIRETNLNTHMPKQNFKRREMSEPPAALTDTNNHPLLDLKNQRKSMPREVFSIKPMSAEDLCEDKDISNNYNATDARRQSYKKYGNTKQQSLLPLSRSIDSDSGMSEVSAISINETDSENFPELRKLSRYVRASTHSRLYKLLQGDENESTEKKDLIEECTNIRKPKKIIHNVSVTRRNNPNVEQEAETMEERRQRLNLPLMEKDFGFYQSMSQSSSAPSSPAPALNNEKLINDKQVNEKLVSELVQSLLMQKRGKVFRHLPIEKLHEAAVKILQEELQESSTVSTEESIESTPALTPQEFKTHSSYTEYYDSWENSNINSENINRLFDTIGTTGNSNDENTFSFNNENIRNYTESSILPSKAFKTLQDQQSGLSKKLWSARCPKLSSKSINKDLARVSEVRESESPEPCSNSFQLIRRSHSSELFGDRAT